jgi:sulfur-oxidizing protein SoxX
MVNGVKRIMLTLAACALGACAGAPETAMRYEIERDAIAHPLTSIPGDPARGREVVVGREASCLFCHTVPAPTGRFMGTIGPGLSGVGGRLTAGQLRLRIVDPTRVNREAIMPAYFRVDGLNRVAQNHRGKPILTAQQVEDVVAYLMTLK